MKSKNRKISQSPGRFYRLLLILSMVVCSLGASAGQWKLHPGFDDAPMRIIDTEKYTFFLLFQQWYNINYRTVDTPVTAGFIYSKENPDRGIVPATDLMALNGGSIRTCEYSPDGKFLAILYMDGGIDMVDDSGGVRHCDFLMKRTSPLWTDVKALTVSGTEIWIATSGGYVVVDGLSGRVNGHAEIPESANLRWIGRCGERIVMLTDTAILDAPADNLPRSYSGFSPVSLPSGWTTPVNLMPRHDTSFFFLSNREESGKYMVNLAYHGDGRWNFRSIDALVPVLPIANEAISNIFERNFFRNKNGWIFSTAGALHQLYNERASDASDIMETVPGRKKSDPAAGRPLGVAGSWDGSSCFVYCARGKFSPGIYSEHTWLIDDDNALRPKGPAVAWATHLGYSHDFGLLAVNYGYTPTFPSILNKLPALLSAYKDGEWSFPNPAYCPPRSAEENPNLLSLYNRFLNRFPVTHPNGLVVDPVNKDYVWMGSVYTGMAAINLRDPKSDPIHLGAPSDPLKTYPGFYLLLEDSPLWGGYAPLSTPSFDTEGNLWAAHHNYIAGHSNSQALLYMWPRANREKVLESGNSGEIEGIRCFPLGIEDSCNSMIKVFAPSQPSNSGFVLVFLSGMPRQICRFTHQGTFDDTSDDIREYFHTIEDQYGARWEVSTCNRMIEDPITGMIWMGDDTFLVGFDPKAEISGGVIKGVVLDVSDREYQGNPLAFMDSQDMVFDDGGRLWVATQGNGVWGFSADKRNVIAHYTSENSSLPDDRVYGLAWNPVTHSLMVSTHEGMAEVWPDVSDASTASEVSVAVWPREVKADYTGTVTVTGVLPGAIVCVLDRNGKETAVIRADAEGHAFWSLTDTSGRKVKSGFYTLKGTFGEIEIAVMR